MKREVDSLCSREFDIVVIGGGIQGICVAKEAVDAGLSVALVERSDFGAATSHNSFKLIHAGFRYLQHADIKRIRESALESRRWLERAPGFIRPLPFILPAYGFGTRGREAFACAVAAYALLTRDRNRDLPEEARLADGRVLSRAEILERVPGLASRRLRGGVVWYDGQMQDADRILLRIIEQSVEAGAVAANYVEALRVRRVGDTVEGVEAIDLVSGRELEIRGKLCIVCAGPWSHGFLQEAGLGSSEMSTPALVKGLNVVVRGRRFDFGLGVNSGHRSDALVGATNRVYLITPWHECSVIGTTHEIYRDDPNSFSIASAEVSAFLDELNNAYPPLELSMDDVVYCYGGLTPGNDRGDSVSMRSRSSAILDYRRSHGVSGLMSVVGVKWTTARSLAERAVTHALSYYPGAERRAVKTALFEPDEYEHSVDSMAALGAAEWADRSATGEMAVNLSDALLRRTTHLVRGGMSAADVQSAIEAMSRVHDWTPAEVQRQRTILVTELEAHLATLPG